MKWAKLVRKNLGRRPLRTALTIGGVALAMVLLILVESLSGGLDRALSGTEAARTLIVYRANRYCPQTSILPQYYGERIDGLEGVESVLPAADAATRTIEVRIALANREGRLRPGMTAQVRIEDPNARPALVVPTEAVIRTGTRTMVIVANDGGYAPTEVQLGRQSGDSVEIRSGLSEGQRVVASGQFLIDSEASLSGALGRLQASSVAPDEAAASFHTASGRVTALSGATISIAHGAVSSLSWPAMTMQFSLARPALATDLRVGDQVAFRFRQNGAAYVVEEISKTGAPR